MTAARHKIHQVAVIPIRAGRICLITSRSGKRWVVPKGCLEPDKTAGQVGLLEAWEEAGLVGVLGREAVGTYIYKKCGNTYHVTVFLMQVTRVTLNWPECSWRKRRWVQATKARALVEHRGLREIIQTLMPRTAAQPFARKLVG